MTPAEQASGAFPRLRWRTTLPLVVVLALCVHAFLPRLASLHETAAVLHTLRWWVLGLALLAELASYCANAYTVRAVAHLSGDQMSIWLCLAIAVAGGSVGLLAGGPVGYAAATHRWMRARGHSEQSAALCGWLPGLLNITTLIAFGFLGLIALYVQHALTQSQLRALAPAVIGVLAIVAVAAWILADTHRLTVLISTVRRVINRIRRRRLNKSERGDMIKRIEEAQHVLRGRSWRAPVLGAVANAGFDVLALYALFYAANATPSLAVLLSGYGLPQVLGHLSFLPGGIGIVEGGMAGIYVALGVPKPTAVLVVLAYRGYSFWLPTLIGFPSAVVLTRRKKPRARTDAKSLS